MKPVNDRQRNQQRRAVPSPPQSLSPASLLQAALKCYQNKQFEQARQLCESVSAGTPQYGEARHLLAIIAAHRDDFPSANRYFEDAIAASPKRADFYSNYANALLTQGRLDDALHHCQASLACDPDSAATHNILGSVWFSKNRPAQAADCFHKALAVQPDNPQVLNNLGNALQKLNKADDAIACYRKALALQERYPQAHNNLGLALKQRGNIGAAYRHFTRATHLQPDFSQAKHNALAVDPVWLEPLQGRRVYLRRYQAQDAPYLHECHQNAAFMSQYNCYIPRHQQIDDLAAALAQAHAKHPCVLKTMDWVIFKLSDNTPVGIANLVDIAYRHRRAEFQIGLPNPTDHTSGIGLEAALLVLDYAFNRIGLNKLVTLVYGHNPFAQKNAQALGFVQESHLREQVRDKDSGAYIDLFGSGMTLRDFRNNERLSRLSKQVLGREIVHSHVSAAF